ncbi:MAG: cupin domain-containing protein [Bradyrhizobium sp.]|jgi:hypothetical protein|nr:MAG: cupin domain-containing protein [Bradyrhizobium sp.]
MFTIPEGEIELMFRGEVRCAAAGSTVNVPAHAPHFLRNESDRPARRLCICAPAGREPFSRWSAIPSTAAASPVLGQDERAERVNAQRHARPKTEPSRYGGGLCSAGASLGRANAELVKLNAPVLLPSAPKLLPLARRGAPTLTDN